MSICRCLFHCLFPGHIEKLPSTSVVNLEDTVQLVEVKEGSDNDSDIIKLDPSCRLPVTSRQVRFSFDPTPHFGKNITFTAAASEIKSKQCKKNRRRHRKNESSKKIPESLKEKDNSPLYISSSPV